MGRDRDDPFELARDRGVRILQGVDDEERMAYVARAIINAVFRGCAIPEELRPLIHAEADRLSEETTLDPDAVAFEPFRQHGYRAEMTDVGGVIMLRATRVHG